MVTFIVGTSVFLLSTATLLHFVMEPPGGTQGLEHADLKSRAAQGLDVLLSSHGHSSVHGAQWAASADGVNQLKRLGLLQLGSSIRVDPAKFEALANGSVWSPSGSNGAVDYTEAKKTLGLEGYDFHLRAYPLFDPFLAGTYGVEGMETFRVAYVGDFVGAVEQPSSELERGQLAALPIGFQNATRVTPLGVGDAFRDDKDELRNFLVPNLGSSPVQSVISRGNVDTKHGFRTVNSTLVSQVAPGWLNPSSALALVEEDPALPTAADFGYTKNREIRAVLGLANMSAMPVSATLAWKEWVDTAGDTGDYGYVEVSPDDGATWYPLTNAPLSRSTGVSASTLSRSVGITAANCAPCLGQKEVWVALHWVADNDNLVGKGWIVDDVTLGSTTTTFRKDFERPAYDLLVIGSNVDQNALTAAEVKHAIRDYVQEHGGRLVVLGGQTNTNWLQPLFHVGIRDANPGIASPDATHPLLTVPNDLDWSSYDNNGKAWEFSANSADALFSMVVGSGSSQHVLSVSDPGAFGKTGADGVVMLSTYLPYSMEGEQAKRFFANVLTYGRYHRLYLEVGPEIPAGVPVASATRTATMDKSRVGESFLEMAFVLYVWNGAASAMTVPGALEAGAPRNLAASAGDGAVTLTWDEPLTRADTVTEYRIHRGTMAYTESFLGTVPATARTFHDTGLTNGRTYFYYVTANNPHGDSDASAHVSATPLTTPGVPQAVTALGAPNAIVLTWDAPASTGGSAIQSYYVYGGANTNQLTELGNTSNTTWQDTQLATGQQRYYVVHAFTAAGHGANSTVVQANALGAPTAPLALAAVGGSGEIALTWTAPTAGSPTDYQIYRGGALGALTPLATTGGTNTSFVDRAVLAGQTWYYEVRGVNTYGAGAASAPALGSTLATPSAPTLTATGLTGAIALAWTPPTLGAPLLNYTLLRSTDGGSTWAVLADLPATTVDYTDGGLGNAVTRHYVLRAYNAQGAGELSEQATATTLQPAAPLALNASGGVQSISLTWTPPVTLTNLTHYTVSRSTDGVTFTHLAEVPLANVTFTDATLGNGETRHYVVRANNTLGSGLPSPSASATTLAPSAPLLPAATAGVRQVSLSWAAPLTPAGLTHYSVWRSTDGVSFTFLASTGGTNTSFVDATLGDGTLRHYQVRANNSAGAGAASTTVQATTHSAPSAPLTLLATPLAGQKMSLLWGAPTSDGGSPVTHYELWRKAGLGGTYARVADIAAPTTSHTDGGLSPGVTYYYYVRAVNAVGPGAASGETSGTALL